jgi:hypothetical protein
MTSRRAMTALLLGLLAAGLVATPTTYAAGGTTRMVDDDGHAAVGDCAGHASVRKSIQKAVDDSADHDTILVCPGTYEEQVTVLGRNDLTIRSVVPFKAVILTPQVLDSGAPYLVGIGLSRNDTLQGFTLVARTAAPCQVLGAAILTAEATGVMIRGNRIRATGPKTLGDCGFFEGIQVGFGVIMPASASVTAGVRHAWSVAAPAVAPAAGPPPSRATVAFNSIRDFKGAGIVASDAGTRALIRRNSVRFWHLSYTSGVPDSCGYPIPTAGGGSRARVIRSTLKAASGVLPAANNQLCFSIGIAQGIGASGNIRDNRVSSGPGSVDFTAQGGVTPATPVMLAGILQFRPQTGPARTLVSRNVVYAALAGIATVVGDGTSIASNRISNTVNGVFVAQTVGASIKTNTSTASLVGIGVNDAFVFSLFGVDVQPSHDNRIKANHAGGNLMESCYDDTLGSGSQGSANTWTGNTAETNSSGPAGICGAIAP